MLCGEVYVWETLVYVSVLEAKKSENNHMYLLVSGINF